MLSPAPGPAVALGSIAAPGVGEGEDNDEASVEGSGDEAGDAQPAIKATAARVRGILRSTSTTYPTIGHRPESVSSQVAPEGPAYSMSVDSSTLIIRA